MLQVIKSEAIDAEVEPGPVASIKLSVSVQPKTVKSLKRLKAKRPGETVSAIVQRAVGLYELVEDQGAQGVSLGFWDEAKSRFVPIVWFA